MATSINDSSNLWVASAAVVSVKEKEKKDIEKKDKSRFVFQLDINWSDDTKSVCFRGYQQFFEFQCKLLDSFPEEAGLEKGSQRTLPYLPGKQVFRRSTKQLAMDRLPELDQYIKELIGLPEHISHSALVTRFFKDEETVHYIKNFEGSQS